MSNVVSLMNRKKAKDYRDPFYEAQIANMDKFDLLQEMLRFQEQRSQLEEMSVPMMVQGKILFGALEKNAETKELALLAGSYRRHLEYELQDRS